MSLRAAAEAIGINHVTYWKWESGKLVPSLVFKQAIETWTDGAVTADSWPLTDEERRVARAQRGKTVA